MPEILLKTITQQSFKLEVEETSTVADLKQRIENTKGKDSFPVEGQKLIFNGRVLEDSVLVADLKVEPPKFIVVMVVKKPAAKAPAAAAQQTTPAASSSATPPPAGAEQEKKKETAATAAEDKAKAKDTRGTKETGGAASPEPEVTAEHAEAVANIVAMGYPKEEVVRAMRAAFFNADRAVEYLCTGIPEGLNLQEANAAGSGSESGDEGGAPQDINFLAQNPQFQQLRDMIRSNPAALPQIIQQIAETNPELMGLIANHQDQFLQLLNAGGAAAGGAGGGAAAAGTPAQGGGAAPRRVEIPVTPQEREAINRLIQMGFPEALVVEAYFACDKNEDLAVNYVLARMEEFHAEMSGAGAGGGQQPGSGGDGAGGAGQQGGGGGTGGGQQ